jgi:hypothetical protein
MTNLPSISGFANLEGLRIVGVQSAGEPLLHLPLGSVALPCLQRAIKTVRWAFLDENLANLVRRHEGCRPRTSKLDEGGSGGSPWLASTGSTGGRIGSSSAQNIVRVFSNHGPETQLFLEASPPVSCILRSTNYTVLEPLLEMSSPSPIFSVTTSQPFAPSGP